MKQGIDISKWQGAPKWDKLAAEHKVGRLDFVILRAGYGGSTVDPCFESNYAAARAAGVPMGAYWYAYWGPYTPAQEAASFLRTVANKKLEYGIWYDVEYEPDILALSKTARTDRVLEGLAVLAASGRYVGLYASTDMINNRLEYDRLRAWDIWVAQYSTICTCKLPYGIWQYTSNGSVSGIAGRVDCDRAYKDYPAIVVGPLAGDAAVGSDIVDKPSALPSPAMGEETRLPREVHTWRVIGVDKPGCDRLIGLCDQLGLYIVGTIDMPLPDLYGPDKLVQLALRLELLTGSSLRIGPMTRGDLLQVLDEAAKTGLPMQATLEIGPVSTGDTVTLKALCAELGRECTLAA